MADFIIGDDAGLLAPSGSRIGGNGILVEDLPYSVGVYPVISSVRIATQEEVLAFKLPDFYEMLPEIVRAQDTTLVERGEVPLYAWDSIPTWDLEPFTWDEVIGPEPILKTTVRVMQLELEKTCHEIASLALLHNLSRVPKEFLSYQAGLLGTPLPSASEIAQRSFLRELVRTYRRKGTPLSFFRLFEQLGFDLTLNETYQRRGDAATVPGPQMALKTNTLVIDEPLGTTILGETFYEYQVLNTPIARGTVKLEVFDSSATDPSTFIDNGEGGWSDGVSGSIDYFTGRLSITLPGVPSLIGQPIQVTYHHQIDAFPDIDNQRYTDRVRSSVVKFAISPKDPSVGLTLETIDRIELYLELLKPAHVIIRNLDLVLNLSDDETLNSDDDLNPLTYAFVESLFGTLYLGMGWAQEDNGSIDPDPSITTQHRDGNEFLTTPDVYTGECPYVYPWFCNGNFKQHPIISGTVAEADWTETTQGTFDSAVTADISPTTTNVSISKGAGTALGVGDTIAFEDGPAGGEARIITVFTDMGTYYDVQWASALSVAPTATNDVQVLPVEAVNLRNLETGFRQQDPFDLYFGFNMLDGASPPDGLLTGPFTATSTKIPFLASSVTYLRFTIAGVDYEETATATGAFTNVNGFLTASSINYTTGAASATFNTAPDNLTQVQVFNVIAATADMGTY
jgi:hypothetical protein